VGSVRFGPDGALIDMKIFAYRGGEGVAVDSRGNVYIAAGQIYVYDPTGKQIDTINVPERPIQLSFAAGTLAHSSLPRGLHCIQLG